MHRFRERPTDYHPRTELWATLSALDARSGAERHNVRLRAGQDFTVGGRTFRVDEVEKRPGGAPEHEATRARPPPRWQYDEFSESWEVTAADGEEGATGARAIGGSLGVAYYVHSSGPSGADGGAALGWVVLRERKPDRRVDGTSASAEDQQAMYEALQRYELEVPPYM